MAISSSTSLRWLILAVFLPLLLLGGLAWWGTRSQVRAAWSAARDDAKIAAEIAAESLARGLADSIIEVPQFEDPPSPGAADDAADSVLDGQDQAALRALRDNPSAGISPAGLPRQVLAAFRLWGISRSPEDGKALLEIATHTAPSLLTVSALDSLGPLAAGWVERWRQGDFARAWIRRHPEADPNGIWISEGTGHAWVSVESGRLRFVGAAALEGRLRESARQLPTWAGIRLLDRGAPIAGLQDRGEVLATAAVDFGGKLYLEILAARPALFEAAAREQARWTLGMLTIAVSVSAGALVFIHRAVERERRLNTLKSDFVASVSHELRAPVASIRLMADALVAGKIEPATARDFHGLISREGARLSTLIENVLDFARIEQGRKQWHFETADLGALVAETIDLMEPLANEKSIALVSTGPLSSMEAYIDPGAIQQAIVNLLDNAIKFSPARSRVEISVMQRDTEWEIRIADQGPGIPPAEQQRVFEKFHRLGNELRRETQGTGIGLSLVKAVAEAHGGRVVLESAPGRGSSFILIGPIRPIRPIP